ncbi:hypothetical protein PCANC_07721 [Puccinia coronata f. sp. avenae]|uniref:Uncharacterized protein n=1 Tax=Puccinia coronata f. sp. avenae TaxID=200324 RepID=A0A2N5V278_9BASI|nr:hypothetical protein PCASD_04884 [Puccinia coronata f. sp. avenae]PLW52575.1 hypothetical protein PCANC_07721 [Puccinia coronata f. sp. avenae]
MEKADQQCSPSAIDITGDVLTQVGEEGRNKSSNGSSNVSRYMSLCGATAGTNLSSKRASKLSDLEPAVSTRDQDATLQLIEMTLVSKASTDAGFRSLAITHAPRFIAARIENGPTPANPSTTTSFFCTFLLSSLCSVDRHGLQYTFEKSKRY